jgi:stalled ribosome rescue protein Dom34
MQILKRKITEKNGSGIVKIQPQEQEDMYCLYNLISEGDRVTADTIRNVRSDRGLCRVNYRWMKLHLRLHLLGDYRECKWGHCKETYHGAILKRILSLLLCI